RKHQPTGIAPQSCSSRRRLGTRGRFSLIAPRLEEFMRRSFLAATIVPALAFAAVTLGSAKEAAAGPTVDLDLNLGTAIQTQGVNRVDFSLGGGAEVGYRYYIPGTYLFLQPEIGGHYMRFGFNSNYNPGYYEFAGTLNGGAKFGLTGIVQPNVFAHLGLGILG